MTDQSAVYGVGTGGGPVWPTVPGWSEPLDAGADCDVPAELVELHQLGELAGAGWTEDGPPS